MRGLWLVSMFDTLLRLGSLAAMWGIVLYAVARGSGAYFTIGLSVLPVAFLLSHLILRRRFIDVDGMTAQPAAQREPHEKPKRGDDLSALLSLLDEDDAYEVRQHIKRRLIERVESGADEEIELFEALLDTRDRQKRR